MTEMKYLLCLFIFATAEKQMEYELIKMKLYRSMHGRVGNQRSIFIKLAKRGHIDGGTFFKEQVPFVEPIFFPKGDLERTCYFDLCSDRLAPRYGKDSDKILKRFRREEGFRIDVENILNDELLKIPLDLAQSIKRRSHFSVFLKKHLEAANQLITIFLDLKNVEELIAFAAYCRDRVNPELFVHALATVILHREDTKHLELPPYAEIFPKLFLSSRTILEAREMAHVLPDPSDRIRIEIPQNHTGNDRNPEHRLAYFREDLGISMHHWHWHLIYPPTGPDITVKKDRRGELFYYLHRQVTARYNIERLCNNFDLVERLLDWKQPIEGYFPELSLDVAEKPWPSRPDGMVLRNIDRLDLDEKFDLEDLIRYKERIYEAIHRRKIIDSHGNEIDIANDRGIDILGNIVESSSLSVNSIYYGSLHNCGHYMLSLITDPTNKYNEEGVMKLPHTSMRDPIFYRWHAFIDDIFTEHKNTLTSYNFSDLIFEDVQIKQVTLRSYDSSNTVFDKNVVHTFFMKSDINMSRGLDFLPRGPVLVRVTHLNHNDFTYTIKVVNTSRSVKYGTVRIFMAPVIDFGNFTLDLAQQKDLMIEMDKFVVELLPGRNKIVRKSTESSVTIPFEQTFRNVDAGRPKHKEVKKFEEFNFCGCGWPQHMLVPKGSTDGFPMVLFVMISDNIRDRVEDLEDYHPKCKTGISYCGLRNKKYPDKRPMGYPFDRRIHKGVTTLEEFLTPNMAFTPITVLHFNNVKEDNTFMFEM